MRLFILPALASVATAIPGMAGMHPSVAELYKRALPISENEGNSGPIDSVVFDPQDQFVDVRPGTTHQFIAPGPNDKRGPCPGLNAAANHGFLPRSGITTIAQTVAGLKQAFGLGEQFAAALSVIAIALTGDPTAPAGGTWSIGGGYAPSLPGGLLSNPSGISFSHNKYESDASPGRADAYLNGGDAVSLQIDRFDDIYRRAANLTLDNLRDHNKVVHDFSIQNNPYFFQAPFAGLVPPVAHHFVVNLMSNHSADNINGYLTRDILKSFFSVTGPDGAHVWNGGQEKIPQNWYRRPSSNPYDETRAVADLVILATKYPDVVRIGGNTGTPNSFVGVNPGDLTGGVYTSANLLQGNNIGCFAFQAVQQGLPSALSGRVRDVASVVALVNRYLDPVIQNLNCPALNQFDQSSFNQFPGYDYDPQP